MLRQAVDLPCEERVAVREDFEEAADELDVGGAACGAGAEDLLAAQQQNARWLGGDDTGEGSPFTAENERGTEDFTSDKV